VSRALLIGLAAERLAEATELRVVGTTLGDRVALLGADAPTLDSAALEAVSAALGGLTAAEEDELTRAWLYYLAHKEVQ
jgi:hypothetical protein